jgi:ubiquinone/menaquinone biosynthesis C-methylase UbiE
MSFIVNIWRGVVGFGFRLLYNELAFTYDWVSRLVSLGQWKCWQRSVFQFIGDSPNPSILELAHGTGELQLDFSSRGLTAIGVDLSQNMGAIARHKVIRSGISPRLSRCMAQALPFADAQFDVVICTFPTPFIFEAETLDEMHRVLRDNGQALIVLTGVFATRGLHIRLLEWLYRITGQRSGSQPDIGIFQPILERVQCSGFQPHMERVDCPQSAAYVLVARKM